jgi:hypothetical protein
LPDLPVNRISQPGKQNGSDKIIEEYFQFLIQVRGFGPYKERVSGGDRKTGRQVFTNIRNKDCIFTIE